MVSASVLHCSFAHVPPCMYIYIWMLSVNAICCAELGSVDFCQRVARYHLYIRVYIYIYICICVGPLPLEERERERDIIIYAYARRPWRRLAHRGFGNDSRQHLRPRLLVRTFVEVGCWLIARVWNLPEPSRKRNKFGWLAGSFALKGLPKVQ